MKPITTDDRPLRRAVHALIAAAAAGASLPVPALAAESSTISEVLVTARKRVETLQDVPLAVSAIDGATIEAQGIQDVTQVYSRVPNLYFTAAGGAGPDSDYQYLVIRGVGFNGGLEPAVGVFIDGMYQPQVGFDTSFLDIERLEVLRGPQGTLFGRNTQAGAVNIVTKKPGRTYEGRVEVEAGRFDTYRVLSAFSGPLSDTLSGGIDLQYGYTKGWSHNVTLDLNQNYARQMIGRGTLVWSPSDSFTGTMIIDGTLKHMREQAFGSPLSCHCYDNIADQIGPEDYKNTNGAQLNLDWKLAHGITLTSITGRRQVKSQFTYDWDGGVTDQTPMTLRAVTQTNSPPIVPVSVAPQPITVRGAVQTQPLDQKFVSQELRLAGNGPSLDWLTGAYYFRQDMLQPRAVDIGPGAPFVPLYIRERFTEQRDGWALFGQLTYKPVERVEVTLGSRYSDETTQTGGERVINIANAAIRAFVKDDKTRSDNVSSMAAVSYKFTPGVLAYATWAQGWKAGGVNRYPSRANSILPYDDEKSTNVDVGLKAAWLDRRLLTNISVFHIDIKQQQVVNVVPDPNGLTPITVISNAGKSTSQGVEAEITAKLMQNLKLDLSYGFTDGKFDQFTQFGINRAGARFWFVPRNTASVTLDYGVPMASERALDLSVNWRYVGDYGVPDGNVNAAADAELKNPAYDRVDVRARLSLQEHWEITGYMRNVLNSYDYTQINRDAFSAVQTPQQTFVQTLEPRTYGVIATKRW
jgi:iron complex outermembrane receptor protein